MVFIPVRSVMVAEPPRMSMDDTIILVARLSKLFQRRNAIANMISYPKNKNRR